MWVSCLQTEGGGVAMKLQKALNTFNKPKDIGYQWVVAPHLALEFLKPISVDAYQKCFWRPKCIFFYLWHVSLVILEGGATVLWPDSGDVVKALVKPRGDLVQGQIGPYQGQGQRSEQGQSQTEADDWEQKVFQFTVTGQTVFLKWVLNISCICTLDNNNSNL